MNDRPHRHAYILSGLAVLALVHAWVLMTHLSASDPWYRNTDMNMHNLVDALTLNSGLAPKQMDQPGVTLKCFLALDYRIRHELGLLPVWNLQELDASPDPVAELPALVRIGRVHSRVIVMLLILCAAGLTHDVTRNREATVLCLILLSGCSGLLFHGLLTRPELLCVGFGGVLALWAAWRSSASRWWPARQGWLVTAGFLGGLSAMGKLPGVCFVAMAFAWCWIAAWIAPGRESDHSDDRGLAGFTPSLVAVTGGLATFWLLVVLTPHHDDLGPVVVQRMRLAGLGAALLPLLVLPRGRGRTWSFLRERIRELGLLAGGLLGAFAACYLLARLMLPVDSAGQLFTRALHFLVNPGPYMVSFLSTTPNTVREALAFMREAPFAFGGAGLAILVVFLLRGTSPRLRAFIVLLAAGAIGLVLLLSRRYFAAQYGIFPQVPLLIVVALGFHAFCLHARETALPGKSTVQKQLIFAVALLLMVTAYFRLQPKYTCFQDDARLPTNEFTRTFIFDHDAHPAAYRELMRRHYGDRQQFVAHLEAYLADPAHRR